MWTRRAGTALATGAAAQQALNTPRVYFSSSNDGCGKDGSKAEKPAPGQGNALFSSLISAFAQVYVERGLHLSQNPRNLHHDYHSHVNEALHQASSAEAQESMGGSTNTFMCIRGCTVQPEPSSSLEKATCERDAAPEHSVHESVDVSHARDEPIDRVEVAKEERRREIKQRRTVLLRETLRTALQRTLAVSQGGAALFGSTPTLLARGRSTSSRESRAATSGHTRSGRPHQSVKRKPVSEEPEEEVVVVSAGRRGMDGSHAKSPKGKPAPAVVMEGSWQGRYVSPEDCPVDEVLLEGLLPLPRLPELVQQIADPDAEHVENVSLTDYCGMIASRQLRAVGEKDEIHIAVSCSVPFQAASDLRKLQLAGLTTVSKWHKAQMNGSIRLSPFSSGRLEQAYNTLASNKQGKGEQAVVLSWLQKAIQRAIAEEFQAAALSGSPLTAPLALASTSSGAAAAQRLQIPAAGSSQPAPTVVDKQAAAEEEIAPSASQVVEDDMEAVEALNHRLMTGSKRGAPPIPRAAQEEQEALNEDEVEAYEEMEEDELERPAVSSKQAVIQAAQHPVQKAPSKQSVAVATELKAPPEAEPEEEYEEVEEFEEVEEEVGTPAPAAPAPPQPPSKEEAALLARLSDLIITQFNSADGYLRCTKREVKSDEKRGLTIVLDDETALIDTQKIFPLLYQHSFHPSDPLAIRAMQSVVSRFYEEQKRMETEKVLMSDEVVGQVTTDEKKKRKLRVFHYQLSRFYQQRSVDTLVWGSVLLKSLAREDEVCLDPGLPVPPPFGFPLLSSDTRSFQELSPAPHTLPSTNMTDEKIHEATGLFAEYFSHPKRRATPFMPPIDANVGCSVVQLRQSTLHLYETSMKTRVEEEEVRLSFASALLGTLHIIQQEILPHINTISYHIVVTARAAGSSEASAAEAEMPHTSVVGIDFSGQFSPQEKKRLCALALPLGLGEEVEAGWNCLEDVVMAVENQTGATVEHDIIQGTEDLESFLTPTLLSLLPEEESRDSSIAQLMAEEEGASSRAHRGKRGKQGLSSLPPFVSHIARQLPVPEGDPGACAPAAPGPIPPAAAQPAGQSPSAPAVEAEGEEDEVEVEEVEEVEEIEEEELPPAPSPPPATPLQSAVRRSRPSLPAAPPAKKCTAAPPPSSKSTMTKGSSIARHSPPPSQEALEDEEAYAQEEAEVEEAPRSVARPAGSALRAGTRPHPAVQPPQVEEEAEPGDEFEEVEEVEEIEDEYEEPEPPAPPPPPPAARMRGRPHRPRMGVPAPIAPPQAPSPPPAAVHQRRPPSSPSTPVAPPAPKPQTTPTPIARLASPSPSTQIPTASVAPIQLKKKKRVTVKYGGPTQGSAAPPAASSAERSVYKSRYADPSSGQWFKRPATAPTSNVARKPVR